ncbi:RNA-splicing ligase RtcB, partial [Candidatus Pacearchaeota archaeon CG10_big_fil_rev_8_21_14_0_10_35_13]
HSRTHARNTLNKETIVKNLEEQGIMIHSGSHKGIIEEAPEVYKDVDEVVRVSHEAGIGRIVARLKPIAVVKG